MIERLIKLFSTKDSPEVNNDHNRQLAAAALLVEAAVMDGTFGDDERAVILKLIKERFELSDAETTELLQDAEAHIDKSNELYTIARTIKDNFEHTERVEMIEMLWHVVYADKELHDYEANLVRRVSGLLYVTDRESGEARKRVLAELGLQ